VTFTYDGQTYEFELCQSHLDEFQKVLQGYASAARRASGGRRSPAGARSPRSNGNSSELAAIREWARTHGYAVSDRGRISAEIRQAFDAAQR
jgi:hypothetical protein